MNMPRDLQKASRGMASGPAVVFTLFFGAFLLFGIVFFVAYHQKTKSQAAISAMQISEFTDSVTAVPSMREWLAPLPSEWIKVTAIEGQGYVIFIPCYTSNSEITLSWEADSVPHLHCENCDSVEDYAFQSLARVRADSALEIRLKPAEGQLRIIPVSDSLLQKYPQAPFKDRLMQWIRIMESGKPDTSLFAPKIMGNEFETLRAEDENPEGCGDEPVD